MVKIICQFLDPSLKEMAASILFRNILSESLGLSWEAPDHSAVLKRPPV
jgi:hypothetical protein